MIKLFHLYKTDMGYYIPLKSNADDWFDGVLNQYQNPKWHGWQEYKITKGKIEDGKVFDKQLTIKALFTIS